MKAFKLNIDTKNYCNVQPNPFVYNGTIDNNQYDYNNLGVYFKV